MNKELFPPDYSSGSTLHGHHFRDIPEPHVYFWPGCSAKRAVIATITKFRGVGRHYYVSLQEEDNPVWDGRPSPCNPQKPVGWTIPWDADWPGRGRHDVDFRDKNGRRVLSGRYSTKIEPIQLIKNLVETHFSAHELRWEDYTGEDIKSTYLGKHSE